MTWQNGGAEFALLQGWPDGPKMVLNTFSRGRALTLQDWAGKVISYLFCRQLRYRLGWNSVYSVYSRICFEGKWRDQVLLPPTPNFRMFLSLFDVSLRGGDVGCGVACCTYSSARPLDDYLGVDGGLRPPRHVKIRAREIPCCRTSQLPRILVAVLILQPRSSLQNNLPKEIRQSFVAGPPPSVKAATRRPLLPAGNSLAGRYRPHFPQ